MSHQQLHPPAPARGYLLTAELSQASKQGKSSQNSAIRYHSFTRKLFARFPAMGAC